MSYQALYRKYRSQSFEDLVGQDHVVRSLQNAIARGRIAHAYLFTGPRGTGKTSTARLLAKALNCTGGPSVTPPADCPICAEITAGNCLDVIEMDAASESGVDEVREAIVEASEYQPAVCRYKVFIIDEVHDLSAKAFDALLKTIEEPPAHVIFILATTEFNKVPPTIRSRCQKYEFHRGTIRNLVERLEHVCKEEAVEYDSPALHAIARLADGGFRDALTLLEQVLLNSENKVTLDEVYAQLGLVNDQVIDQLLLAICEGEIKSIVTTVDSIYRQGRDPRSILESMLLRLADLTRAAYEIESTNDSALETSLVAFAARLGHARVLELRGDLSSAHRVIRDISLPRQWLESELIRIALPKQVVTAAPAEVAPAPTPAPAPKAVVETVSAYSAPAPAAPVVAEKPKVERVAATPPLSETDLNWRKLVTEISSLSKAAAPRLSKTRIRSSEGEVLTIEFDRKVDADWVRQNDRLQRAMIESWTKITGITPVLNLDVATRQAMAAPVVEKVAVESVYEGDRLAELAHQVFEVEPQRSADRLK